MIGRCRPLGCADGLTADATGRVRGARAQRVGKFGPARLGCPRDLASRPRTTTAPGRPHSCRVAGARLGAPRHVARRDRSPPRHERRRGEVPPRQHQRQARRRRPRGPALAGHSRHERTERKGTKRTMADTTHTTLGSIGQVSLLIRDVARAERFYGETLGLPHVFTFGDLAFFDAGRRASLPASQEDPDWQPCSVLYFTVDDIHAAQETLAVARRPLHRRAAPHPHPRRRHRGVDDVLR